MAKIELSSPQGLTHFKLSGVYITKEAVARLSDSVEFFVRGKLGYMDGAAFVPVSVFEHNIVGEDMALLLSSVTVGGKSIIRELETFILNYLVASGTLPGQIV